MGKLTGVSTEHIYELICQASFHLRFFKNKAKEQSKLTRLFSLTESFQKFEPTHKTFANYVQSFQLIFSFHIKTFDRTCFEKDWSSDMLHLTGCSFDTFFKQCSKFETKTNASLRKYQNILIFPQKE